MGAFCVSVSLAGGSAWDKNRCSTGAVVELIKLHVHKELSYISKSFVDCDRGPRKKLNFIAYF